MSSILSDSTVEVRVRDNGPGISEENVGRIFNPFFSTREGALGAALGLPSPPTSPAGWAATWWSTIYGEYAEFTMHLPAYVEEAESDEDDPEDMAGIVERMSAQT